jgi:hypothetical protein
VPLANAVTNSSPFAPAWAHAATNRASSSGENSVGRQEICQLSQAELKAKILNVNVTILPLDQRSN